MPGCNWSNVLVKWIKLPDGFESLKKFVMTSMHNLRAFVSKYVSLTEEEFEYFESFFEIRHFKKRESLIREGEVEKYLNYVDSGSARLFFLKGKEEIVMEFAVENEVIGCFNSFFSHKPSHFSIEAMEPLTVFSLTHENLETLFANNAKIETLARLFTREAYLKKTDFDYHRARATTETATITTETTDKSREELARPSFTAEQDPRISFP